MFFCCKWQALCNVKPQVRSTPRGCGRCPSSLRPFWSSCKVSTIQLGSYSYNITRYSTVFYILWQDYNDLIFHTFPLRFREDVVKKELCLLRVLPKFILRYAFRKLLRPWMREKHPCEQQKNPVWWKKWPGNLYQQSTMGIDSKGFMLRICTLLLERSRLLPSRMSWVCRLPWVSGIQLASHQMAALRTSSDVARLSWSMVEFQCSQQWDT